MPQQLGRYQVRRKVGEAQAAVALGVATKVCMDIVGSGTDDVRDALDRRVEFPIVPCK